jgi:hypothetical protein
MLHGYIIDMILCGITYLFLVYFMFTLIKKRRKGFDGDDDDDGGLPVSTPPEIDLPPGVCMPDGSPKLKIVTDDIPEECLA